jgi:hypothetical protein
MVSFGKHLWAGAGAALIGSLCCVGPLVSGLPVIVAGSSG